MLFTQLHAGTVTNEAEGGGNTAHKIERNKTMKKAITLIAGVCAFTVVYFLAFFIAAGVFHAEHWSFVIPFVPAFAAMVATVWGCEK